MDFAPEYNDFVQNHLPNLYQFVIGIAHEDANGVEGIGSGVFVKLKDRHFIASARHCIEYNPRVMLGAFTVVTNDQKTKWRFVPDKPTRIVNKGWHPTLDIGFLEIPDSPGFEVTEPQLCFTQTAEPIHVLGHPVERVEWVTNRMEVDINRCCLSTKVTQSTPHYFEMEYPKTGTQEGNGQLVHGVPFPDPHGVSGGGCFAVSKSTRNELELIEYQLIGVQYSWHAAQRWLRAIPIKEWYHLVTPNL
jgi:hypothetical protein